MKTVEEIINELQENMTTGLEYDWCMVWGLDAEETNGAGDWVNIRNETAKQEAKEYEEKVLKYFADARDRATKCIKRLKTNDILGAWSLIKEACSYESEFGDCPTFGPTRDAIEELMEVVA